MCDVSAGNRVARIVGRGADALCSEEGTKVAEQKRWSREPVCHVRGHVFECVHVPA